MKKEHNISQDCSTNFIIWEASRYGFGQIFHAKRPFTQPASCSKLTMETPEQCVKLFQSQ